MEDQTMAYCFEHEFVYSDTAKKCPMCYGEELATIPLIDPRMAGEPLTPITDEGLTFIYPIAGYKLKLKNPQIFL